MAVARGCFRALKMSPVEHVFLEDAFQAVTKANQWRFLARPDIPGDGGFMFTQHPEVKQIENEMRRLDDHSGASFGWTMRVMEFIAKNGWDAFVAKRELDPTYKPAEKPLKHVTEPFFVEAARVNPIFQQQIQAVDELCEQQGGKITYAQMRELMG